MDGCVPAQLTPPIKPIVKPITTPKTALDDSPSPTITDSSLSERSEPLSPVAFSLDGISLDVDTNLADVLRLPDIVCTPCYNGDVLAAALTCREMRDALVEAHGGKLPPLTLKLLVQDKDRLKWAVDACGVGVDETTAAVAAGEGCLETLQWVVDKYGAGGFSATVCREAARGGHLHILRYARLLLGLPWDGSVCANASAAGHLPVLEWLREHGCPWDKMTPAGAELNGHMHIKRWAIENGCDYSEELVLRLRMARIMAAENSAVPRAVKSIGPQQLPHSPDPSTHSSPIRRPAFGPTTLSGVDATYSSPVRRPAFGPTTHVRSRA